MRAKFVNEDIKHLAGRSEEELKKWRAEWDLRFWAKLRNHPIDKLRESSKEVLKRLFGTLDIPYKIDVFNSIQAGNIIQEVTIKDVPLEKIKKILNTDYINNANFRRYSPREQYDIQISRDEEGFYGEEFSLQARDKYRLMFSIPIGRFKNNKWQVIQ